jgi:hypothetical protein
MIFAIRQQLYMSMKTVVLLFINRNVQETNPTSHDADRNRLDTSRENGGVAAKGAFLSTGAEPVAGD